MKIARESKDDSIAYLNYYRAFHFLLTIGELHRADSVLSIQEKLPTRLRKAEVISLVCRGQLREIQGRYSEATESLLKALKIAEEKNFYQQASEICNSLGIIHFSQEEYDKALEYYYKDVDFAKKNNYEKPLATAYNNIGNIYYRQKDFNQALNFYNMALVYLRKGSDNVSLGNALNNIGSLHMEMREYNKGLQAVKEAVTILENEGNKLYLSYAYLNEGTLFALQNDFASADKILKQAMNLCGEVNSPELYRDTYFAVSDYYKMKNDASKALEYFKRYITVKDSLSNTGLSKQIDKKVSDYEAEKKELLTKVENEKKELQLAEERKRNWLIMIFSVSAFLIVAVFALFLFKRYKITEKQKKVIEEKTGEIIDSINYARRLQNALLLPEEELKKSLGEVFILYKPRDIVSGDFYWFSESEQNKIIAVADCTGHGVPGALMSMLGYENLQNIVLKENITSTSQALKALDLKITETLNKSGKTFRDGMDIALCAFSKKENKLQYSGANRPLVHISNGIVSEYAPDKNTIGGDIDGGAKEYSTKTIHYSKGDLFYLFTDGFADQFGGEKGKKFKYKQLKNKLQEISPLPMNEQKAVLEKIFEAWKGNLDQVDDVCIIGIKI